MNEYMIIVDTREIRVTADNVFWGDGLRFESKGDVVAMFNQWDMWFRTKENVNEAK